MADGILLDQAVTPASLPGESSLIEEGTFEPVVLQGSIGPGLNLSADATYEIRLINMNRNVGPNICEVNFDNVILRLN